MRYSQTGRQRNVEKKGEDYKDSTESFSVKEMLKGVFVLKLLRKSFLFSSVFFHFSSAISKGSVMP